MKKIKNSLKRLWQDESGQGATEYILILVVIVVIVTVFKEQISTAVKNVAGDTGKKLQDALTDLGSTPP